MSLKKILLLIICIGDYMITIILITLLIFKTTFNIKFTLIEYFKVNVKFEIYIFKFKAYSYSKDMKLIELIDIDESIYIHLKNKKIIINELLKSKVDFNLVIADKNNIIPFILVPVISTVISQYLMYKSVNMKRIKYNIKAECVNTYIFLDIKLCIKMISLIRIIYIIIKEWIRSERKPNRKVNE